MIILPPRMKEFLSKIAPVTKIVSSREYANDPDNLCPPNAFDKDGNIDHIIYAHRSGYIVSNGFTKKFIDWHDWVEGVNFENVKLYWTDFNFGSFIANGENDDLKPFGRPTCGGLMRMICRGRECSSLILHATLLNSSLSRCTGKSAAGSFFACGNKECVPCKVPTTNHLDKHYLTVWGGHWCLFRALLQYDVIGNGRGHTEASLRELLEKCGNGIDWFERVQNVPIKKFAPLFGPVDKNITLSAGTKGDMLAFWEEVLTPLINNKQLDLPPNFCRRRILHVPGNTYVYGEGGRPSYVVDKDWNPRNKFTSQIDEHNVAIMDLGVTDCTPAQISWMLVHFAKELNKRKSIRLNSELTANRSKYMADEIEQLKIAHPEAFGPEFDDDAKAAMARCLATDGHMHVYQKMKGSLTAGCLDQTDVFALYQSVTGL